MYQLFSNLGEKGGYDEVFSPGNSLIAYAGIHPGEKTDLPHIFGTATWKAGSRMSPENYASKIAQIMNGGCNSSDQGLYVPFLGVRDIRNIYFYVHEHSEYGGEYALLKWSCVDYCVFKASSECVIFTPFRISLYDTKP